MNIFAYLKSLPEHQLRDALAGLELAVDRQRDYEDALNEVESYVKLLSQSTDIDPWLHYYNEIKLTEEQANILREKVLMLHESAILKGDTTQADWALQFTKDFKFNMPYGEFEVKY